MSTAVQTSLFDLADQPAEGDFALGPLGGMVTRQVLGRGAWVDLLPGWLSGADALFDACRRGAVAGRAAADVRARGRRAPPALLLRRRDPLPHPAAHRGPGGALPRTTRPSSASRSPPPGCASTATAATASPGTATASAAARPRTPWSPSSRSAPPRSPAPTPRRRRDDPAPARPRRPRRDGRLLPAHLGARHPQDQPGGRSPDQRPVPPPRGALRKPMRPELVEGPSTGSEHISPSEFDDREPHLAKLGRGARLVEQADPAVVDRHQVGVAGVPFGPLIGRAPAPATVLADQHCQPTTFDRVGRPYSAAVARPVGPGRCPGLRGPTRRADLRRRRPSTRRRRSTRRPAGARRCPVVARVEVQRPVGELRDGRNHWRWPRRRRCGRRTRSASAGRRRRRAGHARRGSGAAPRQAFPVAQPANGSRAPRPPGVRSESQRDAVTRADGVPGPVVDLDLRRDLRRFRPENLLLRRRDCAAARRYGRARRQWRY